jgi:acetylornithine deacetylase/succinyl-diaminopimelate desuccinylase-like protein
MVLIEMGIPAVICGPGSIRQAHTDDEFVLVEDLPRAARIYTALMADM